MRKTGCFLIIGSVFFFSGSVFAAGQDQTTNDASMEKARADYKILLSKLQEMNTQYKDITGKIAKVVKEEGVPTIDDKTGQLVIKKMDLTQPQPVTTDSGARIQDVNNTMTVSLDMPGLKKESINVGIEDVKMLHVRASRTIGTDVIPIDKLVELPAPAQEKGTEARYEDGVLSVKIPKAKKEPITVPVR